MSQTWSIRLQTGLILILFVGSLIAVFLGAFQGLTLPQREFLVQDRMREASRKMIEAADPELEKMLGKSDYAFEALNLHLRTITSRILIDFPGVEGGFFLSNGLGKFAGFGFPTGEAPPPPNAPGDRLPPATRLGDNPPPKETSFILLQAQNSLSLAPGEYQFDVRTVGPSRVVILTQPIGSHRPAHAVAWTMYRVTKPEMLEDQLHRFQASTVLALAGVALSVILTLRLGGTLKRQRLQEKRLLDELRRSEHLAALGKLLAGVAHEVRNPLAGIRSTVQLWERLPDTARTKDSLQAVVQAVDRLNAIVSRLLYFSRSDRVERQPVQLNEIVVQTFNLVEAQANSQEVSLELQLEPQLPLVQASLSALQEVFLNLTTNALQVMPHGGRLCCTSRSLPQKREVEVCFADTGPGIATDVREHLFEPFFTTRPEGTGLGLALCRQIITQHGGRIDCDTVGPGATFRLVFPVAD